MTGVAAPAARMGAPRRRWAENGALAVLAYVPFLLSSPGKVSADTKQYLYLDPGRLLSRAAYLWDPHIGAGTVPHQYIGYLFPMGPYYWLMDQVGVPDWVAQRLWLGSISLAAVLGARWLFLTLGARRAGALAGALVYMLTPYQLAFTARISALLLPWAALPWLVGLTIRAVRRGGWRDPAIFALITLVIGGTNATTLLFVGLGPVLWLLVTMLQGRRAAGEAVRAGARIGVLTLGVSLWWAVGLSLQGSYGLPVLQLTETLRTVSGSSLPSDLLRGLGNWFFYGGDRLGNSLDQAADYANNHFVLAASYAVPLVALASAAIVRWRYRAYFVVLVVVGTIVGVGSWPYDDPSLYGRLFKSFANGTSLGLALRNTPRVVPLIVLGFAGLLAGGISALTPKRLELVAALAVGALAATAFTPVWRDGYLSSRLLRPETVPAYWTQAADTLGQAGTSTRVLEIPGSNFAAYRWGNTVDPVTPGLTDRPYVAREVLPFGSIESVNLLDALDHRIQEGTFEPSSLAAVARLFDAGTVSVRSDLQWERFDLVRPQVLWAWLTAPLAPGLATPTGFGTPTANAASPALPMLDASALALPASTPDPPPVALFPVEGAAPIVHTSAAAQPVVLAGDGEGIVDAAAAGIVDGNHVVLELASLSASQLRQALQQGADLVLTDSNRRRAQSFFASIRDTTGATERAGQEPLATDTNDQRLDPFPGSGDAARTVTEQQGGTVDATSYGDLDRYTPEDRPVNAVDGNLQTAWRVAGGGDPAGQRLVLQPAEPVRTDHVTLVQPQTGVRDRWVTRVRLTFDTGAPVTVDLGPGSLTPQGQVVRFPARTVRRLEVEPLAASAAPGGDLTGANPVGFAEVRLGDAQVAETVRLPVDLATRVGPAAAGHRLDVVLSRLRTDPAQRGRQDEELSIARRLVLPDARSFALSGTVRVDPNAPDTAIDGVLGTTAPGTTFAASGHLAGDADARASRAFDGDPSTAWSAPIGPQEGQWIETDLPSAQTVDHLDLTVVADGRHSVPTKLRLEADGAPARELTVPPVTDVSQNGATQQVTIPFAPVTGTHLRLVVEAVRPVTTIDDQSHQPVILPVAIAETGLAGVPAPAAAGSVPSVCRSDLLRVDGHAVSVKVTGAASAARDGLSLEPCTGPDRPGTTGAESGSGGALTLTKGSHTLDARPGLDTALDLDRIVLSSGGDGAAAPVTALGATRGSGARAVVTKSGETSFDVKVTTDGTPFWLVLGQSHDDGWTAKLASGRSFGDPRLVDGYANGWLVDPGHAGTFVVRLRWTPQRLVWIGLALSAAVTLACVGIVAATRRRSVGAGIGADRTSGADRGRLADPPALLSPFRSTGVSPPARALLVSAIGAGAVAAAVSRWWIGLVVGLAVLLASRVASGRIVFCAGAPIALAVSKLASAPELGWLAVVLLGADVLVLWMRDRTTSR